MLRSFRAPDDRRLLAAIRDLPRVPAAGPRDLDALFERAERHGLAGVLHDAFVASGVALPRALEHRVAAREVAREADHEAHLAALRRIDDALARAGLTAVALKGALLAQRLYPRPAARPSTDIDLLVEERTLAAATTALADVGYEPWDDPAEARFLAEGHHAHLVHPEGPPLELHFHAFRGFGRTLRSEPLLARSAAHGELRCVRTLSAPDELGYLAVHAASHRFMRLGWLYDLLLLTRRLDEASTAEALSLARETGVLRPTLLALDLLHELLGAPAPVARLGVARQALLGAVVEEPGAAIARAASRFVYSVALCDDAGAAGRYAAEAVVSKARRILAGP